MNILAISCSTKWGSLALLQNNKLTYSKLWHRSKSHGEIITPSLEQLFRETELDETDIDLIAVDKGPGSFTGIRVAVNSAKTLAYSNSTALWAEDSLSIMAEAVPLQANKKLLCCLNAFKNEVYLASFEAGKTKWKLKWKPQSIGIEALEKKLDSKHLLVGDGLDLYWDELKAGTKKRLEKLGVAKDFPNAEHLAFLTAKNYKESKTLDWKSITSLYIKASAAEEKLKKGLLKPLPKL